MTDTTLPLLTAGSAISDGDLFISRQGADTSDKKVTGTQITTYIESQALTFTDTITFNEDVVFAEIDDGNSSTADTIDWSTGNIHKSTLTGNVTYTFTAPGGPTWLTLRLVQDATGSRTATWPATVFWPGGVDPVLTTTASAVDLVSFYYDGTNYHGSIIFDSGT